MVVLQFELCTVSVTRVWHQRKAAGTVLPPTATESNVPVKKERTTTVWQEKRQHPPLSKSPIFLAVSVDFNHNTRVERDTY